MCVFKRLSLCRLREKVGQGGGILLLHFEGASFSVTLRFYFHPSFDFLDGGAEGTRRHQFVVVRAVYPKLQLDKVQTFSQLPQTC
mmetsp:Transcript_96314/g.155408  ORF Transcript_96314/g.155408 Transcript_96314/m.155408 type:complete len:85 (-) Transcript_96314:218-472(-)